MLNYDTEKIAENWRMLWNGELNCISTVIADNFTAHAAPLTGSGEHLVKGRDALDAWVRGIHALLANLSFVYELGPFVDGDHFVVRWKATGLYRGGFPGDSAEALDRSIQFTGTDTLRVVEGKIVEYWGNAHSLWFVQQLGVREVPQGS